MPRLEDLRIGQIVWIEGTPYKIAHLRDAQYYAVGVWERPDRIGDYVLSVISTTPPPKKIKKEGWTNIYYGGPKNEYFTATIFSTHDEAREKRAENVFKGFVYLDTIKVSWEETED